MHKLLKVIIFMSFLFSSYHLQAEDSFSAGVGAGTKYSGLGANFSLLTATDMKYISAGCLSYGSRSGLTCGAGLGWITTDLLDEGSNNHGVGFYLGAIGSQSYQLNEEAIYGAGLGYHYFFNGIDKSGVNIGLSLAYGKDDKESVSGVMFEIGYQF